MYVKQTQKFMSKESNNVIKVTKVQRSGVDHRYDQCTVCDVEGGRAVSSTRRVIFADSIRRRYYKV